MFPLTVINECHIYLQFQHLHSIYSPLHCRVVMANALELFNQDPNDLQQFVLQTGCNCHVLKVTFKMH